MKIYPHPITHLYLAIILSAASFTSAHAQSNVANAIETTSSNITSANPTDWNICNQTSYVLRVSSAYIRSARMQASGWKNLHPGACYTETPPKNSPRFLYAESSPIHQGDIREWAGSVEICAADSDFISDAAKDCKAQNTDEQTLSIRKFLAVDPTDSQTDLIEPEEFGDKAETAGIQRLLRDAGYKISRIDGLSGRRTSETIKTFRKEKKLANTVSNTDLIDALITAAASAKDNIGLEICNDTTSRIWSAIATRHQGGWQSRGWWDVKPKSCAKPFNKPLDGTEAHIFALQENLDETGKSLPDKHLRTISTVPSQFCIAEAKFSALGREFCTENGYNIANFRPITTDNNGITVTLTDTDFTATNPAGLRR